MAESQIEHERDLVAEWIDSLGDRARLLTVPDGRRALTKYDFESFVFTYFRHLLQSPDTGDRITLSSFHQEFVKESDRYTVPCRLPAASRTAWVCPRGAGKSTWLMMLVIWLLAHKHHRFVAIFSATASQAEDMLANIRSQFENNDLLRKDFDRLVRPARRKMESLKLSDNKQLMMQQNGAIITARAVTSQVLGMRIDNTRPQVIVLDDIEKGEAATSSTDIGKLLVTLEDDIFPLSINAHVLWVGTTTRPGGLTEDLVHKALGMDHADWVEQDNFTVSYWPALMTDDYGRKKSMWPERWSVEYLLSIEGTRSFAKNFMCLPSPDEYDYWRPEDFVYMLPEGLTRTIITIDPAVTSKKTSDETGIAVLSVSPSEKKIVVRHCEGVRLAPAELRAHVLRLLEEYPEAAYLFVEGNQGADTWKAVFHDFPIPVELTHSSLKKEIRAANALVHYQRGTIVHEHKLANLERQMIAFPNAPHDDMVDAVTMGVELLFPKKQRQQRSLTQRSYV